MATAKLSRAAFVEALGSCRLLETTQLRELALDNATDLRALALQLLHRGWLTPYQVNRVLAGRGQELLLGHYVLLERLGEGGMAQVFKARHQLINRVVALKVIRPDHLKNHEALTRFCREVRSIAQLAHPNIVGALDADEVNGTHFFVMEFIEGLDLARLVKESGPLQVARACDYVRQAALGLQHAHEKGIVHRDIKPSNLMVTTRQTGANPGVYPWGLIKVLDMGLARSLVPQQTDDSALVTHAGLVIGTPEFLAPEQAANSQQADIRADIYSLGGTAHYLLSGQVPFPGGSTIDKLVRHRFEEPTPLEQLRPEVPTEVAAIVRRMMAKQPENRYQTPRDIAAALAPWCRAGESPAVVPTEWLPSLEMSADQTPLPPKTLSDLGRERHRRWNWTVAAGAACLAASLTFLFFLLGRDSRTVAGRLSANEASQDPLRPFLDQARNPQCDFPQLRGELAAFAFLHRDTPLGRRAVELLRQVPSAFDDLIPRQVPPEERFDIRGAELVAVLGDGRLRHWAAATAVAFDPEGKFILSGGEDRQVYAWDARTGKRRQILSRHDGPVSAVVLGNQGKLAFSASHDQTVRLFDWSSRKENGVLKHPGPVLGLAVSADGKILATATREEPGQPGGVVRLWEVSERKEFAALPGHQGAVHTLAFDPAGRLLASGGEDHVIRLWDMAARKEVATLRGHHGPVRALAFVGNGETLASGSDDKTVRLWDVNARKERHPSRECSHPISAVAAIPGGTLVAAGAIDGNIKIWDAADAHDRGTIHAHEGPIRALAAAPDGKTLASAGQDRHLRFWDIARRQELQRRDQTVMMTMALAPDDAVLATGHAGGRVRLWNPVGDREKAVLDRHQHGVPALAFSPDGSHLASGGWDNLAILWDVSSGKHRFDLRGHGGPVAALAFSPDGRTLLTGSADKTAKLWDAASGQERATLHGHHDGISTAAFAPDGRTLATGSFDRTARLWNVDQAKERAELKEFHGEGVIFTPDGKALLGGGPAGSVRMWNALPGQSPQDSPLPGIQLPWPRAFAVSADGRNLAMAGMDGLVVIWNPIQNKETRRLQFPGLVRDLAFASDGRHLISTNGNGTVAILRLTPPPRKALAMRSLPNGGR